MSDTPRTDAQTWDAIAGCIRCKSDNPRAYVPASFARQLERDNAALKADNDRLHNRIENLLKPIRAKLEEENAALRAALDAQANYQRELRDDRDRLDWLMNHCASFPVTNKSATGVTNILPLRSSIDEAMGLMPSVSFFKEDK